MTEILEACNWSEERAEEIMLFAHAAVSNVIENNEAKNLDDFKKEVVEHLNENFNNREIDVIIKLIDRIGDSPEIIEEIAGYDC